MQGPGLSFKNAFFLAIAALISPSLARASLDFPSYPAKEILAECGKPDFTSYSRARNAEEMIRKNNPDLKRPNFGGQYLLLQVPYMMGTDWLILDCKTGTFLKEVITGQAEFKKDSFLVRLSDKTSMEWKLWTGSTFVKAEETKSPESKPAENSLSSRYAETFSGFPAGPVKSTCAPLKFSSYFRAQNAETHIKNQKTDLSRPNFAGNFILLRVELLFETIHIIASCETGLFYPEYLSGDLLYKADSALAILTKSGKAPDLFLWHAPLWIKRPDPTASDSPFIFNEIAREDARSLIRLLPNPEHHSKVEFEDLVCRTTTPSGCSFRLPGTKEPEKRIAFLEAPSQGVIDLLQRLGRALPKDASGAAGLQIDQGHCISEKSTCKLGVK
jgi:hypothetical protein